MKPDLSYAELNAKLQVVQILESNAIWVAMNHGNAEETAQIVNTAVVEFQKMINALELNIEVSVIDVASVPTEVPSENYVKDGVFVAAGAQKE